jgi:hypothetical protein
MRDIDLVRRNEADTTQPARGEDAMTTMNAGTQVKKGYYFNLATWALQPMPTDGEALPGATGERFFHVPLLLAFVVAPLMGAAFLMFLPFIGFYLALSAAVKPLGRLVHHSATEVAATLAPTWAPGEAHLTGQRTEAEGVEEKGPPAQAPELGRLEAEIEKRRHERS